MKRNSFMRTRFGTLFLCLVPPRNEISDCEVNGIGRRRRAQTHYLERAS